MKYLVGIFALMTLIVAGVVFSPSSSALSRSLSPVRVLAATDVDLTANPDNADNCKQSFLGLIPWYQYMGKEIDSHCEIKCFNLFQQTVANECGQTASDVPGILLAIVDDLLRVSGLVAVAFIFVGSFQYIGSRGNPEQAAGARSTIINALIGLGIAIIAVALVSFIGSQLN